MEWAEGAGAAEAAVEEEASPAQGALVRALVEPLVVVVGPVPAAGAAHCRQNQALALVRLLSPCTPKK